MADNGKLIIKIDGDTGHLEKTLSNVGRIASKSLSLITKGVATIGAAFAAATGASLNFKGELEQNVGGAATVFDKFASDVQEKAETAFKTAGLSVSNFLATANKMGSLFQGTGFTIKQSADMSTAAIQRAADVASIMGVDIKFAMESVAGMAKGNFTMMDNLGVAINDTTLKIYAQEKGLGELESTQDKVNAAYMMFMEKTEKYAGNYEKENETIVGALNTAKAAIQNFMAGTGSVEELSDALSKAVEVASKNIGELAPELARGFGELIKSLIPLIPDILRELIPPVLSTFEELIKELADMAPEILIAITEGVGDAVPVLEPLSDTIVLLTNNFEILCSTVAAGTSAFVTYKGVIAGMTILSKLSTWFTATDTALTAYNAALVANSAAATRGITINGLLLSSLSPLQVMYGVLMGKIKLADAAQKLFNTTLLKNPYALVAAGLAAVVAGIIAYEATHKSATEQIVSDLKEIEDASEELEKSHRDAIKTIDKKASAESAEAEQVNILKDRLYELEDQIKSGNLTDEEATRAKKDFADAAMALEKILPGITDHLYSETNEISIQREEVDKLAQSYQNLMIAKATASAYQSKLEKVTESLIDARELVDQTKNKVGEAKANASEKADQASGNLWNFATTYGSVNGFLETGKAVTDAEEAHSKAVRNVAKLEAEQRAYVMAIARTNAELQDMTRSFETSDDGSGFGERRTKTLRKETKKQSDIIDEQYKNELDSLKFLLDMKQISEEEYFRGIASIRDEYCKEDSDEWRRHTVEIYQFRERQREKAISDELSDLEHARSSGIINEKEYYRQLKEFRDKYFEEGSEEWRKYTFEIEEYTNSLLEKFKNKHGELSNEISGKQTTYSTVTFKLSGNVEEQYTRLGDGGYKSEQLKKYNSMLDELYSKIDEPPELIFENLASMSLEERMNYLGSILKATDEEFHQYMAFLDEEQRLADEAARKELAGLKEEIEEEFGDAIPEGFFDIGENSATEFCRGFLKCVEERMKEAKDTINSVLSSYRSDITLSAAASGTGNTYYDQRSTTVTVPGNSPRATIEALRQNDIYQNHTTSFGG